MVEYLVGGVSTSDRDSVRDLVEDAVLNCRSAARNGVGRGANFEGFAASMYLEGQTSDNNMYGVITQAYLKLLKTLYETKYSDKNKIDSLITDSIAKHNPLNLATGEFDGNVLCSIDTDIVILDTISKIITLMFTSNQFICPTPAENKYIIE